MKKIRKKERIILFIVIAIVLLFTTKTQAALQANTGTQYIKKAKPGEWMLWFRQMEESGQAMGLSETLNSDLTAKESNGIDVHMMRSTEYGAMAILSMSGYGNASNAQIITTTSGNQTGVILNTNKGMYENVAGTISGNFEANTSYYDVYSTENTSAKIGDALGTCVGWHGAYADRWIVLSSYTYFIRGGGGIFSFQRCRNDGLYSEGSFENSGYCRGVAVCGEGL